MDRPSREVLARMPLAEAVLLLWQWVTNAERLRSLWDRGRCYELIISFPVMPRVRRAAQVTVSHPSSARGRPDADAAQYGAIGGERAGATAPAPLRLLVTRQDDRSGTGCTGRFSSDVTTPCARGALGSGWKQHNMTHVCHTTRCASHLCTPLGHAARSRQRVRSSPQH